MSPEGNAENTLEEAVKDALNKLVDPGAGLDVWRMGLIRDLRVDAASGGVALTFHPSSPVCPVAFTLAPAIRDAVRGLPGVSSVSVKVRNYNRAAELEALLADDEGDQSQSGD